MHSAYFDTRFRVDVMPEIWPEQFVILSAWATTGQTWPLAKNVAADLVLEHVLAANHLWRARITGYSPTTGHAEPSWAFPMTLEKACDLGQQFQQDAIYLIESDRLAVTHCDQRRSLVHVGSFRDRLDLTHH